jgi:hypothetical protein
MFSNAIDKGQLETELHQTWKKLSYIDINDSDLLPIIINLNKCIELINIGGDDNLNKVDNMLKEINTKIIILGNYEAQLKLYQYLFVGTILTILFTVSILIWVYGSKIYWNFWFNRRKKWRINFD